MSSKTKTGLFQTPVSKPVASRPTTPRGKLGSSTSLKSDADSPSTNLRFSLDRASPKTVTSRPTTPRGKIGSSSSLADSPSNNLRFSLDRASPKTVTSRPVSRSSSRVSTPDKLEPRINKPSELQAQLQAAQDDLKKAKEKLFLIEKEKSQALSDLKDVKNLADEANEKLQQALVAQKRAEESSEIDNFRAVELEQAGIEAAQQKDDEWKKELASMRSQLLSSQDMTSFLTNTEELQRVKQELAIVMETKNQALAHADEATKIAEIHAEKVGFLSAELVRLKGMLESKAGDECSENGIVAELGRELGLLKEELEKAKSTEQELIEKAKNVVDLKSEVESLRKELDERKACERELVEKEESYEKIVARMTEELASREQDLRKTKTYEQELIERGKLHETTLTELTTKLALMEQNLLDVKTCEHDTIEKDKSYEKTIAELESNIDSLRQNLETVKASEQDLVDREKSHNIIVSGLNSKIDFLKQELDKAERLEEKLVEKEASFAQTVMGLKSEINLLNQELNKAKGMKEDMIEREKLNEKIVRELEFELQVAKSFQEKLTQMESSYEQMNVELEASRMAESYALNSLSEWKRKAEELKFKVAETTKLERLASESLGSALKQLEGNSNILREAECEVSGLKEKVSLLEISLVKRKEDLDELESHLGKANEEAMKAAKVIESVRSELETVKEEKALALENEKLAASSVQDLLEEKTNLVNEMDKLKEEEEKSKMAMESLASALHEVSAELREAKERLLSNQEERENFEAQIEHLQLVLKATSEKYEAMLEDSKQEIDSYKLEFDSQMKDLKVIFKASNDKYESLLNKAKQECDHLSDALNKSELEHANKKTEWEAKELKLLSCVKRLEEKETSLAEEWEQKELRLVDDLKRSEEEKSSMEKEITRLVHLLREAEEKALTVQVEGPRLKSEAGSLKDALDKAKADCLKLEDNLQGKENELQDITKENEQLRAQEDANVRKIDELTKLLREAKARQQSTVNGELSDTDRDYDLLPKVVEFSEENGHLGEKELVTGMSDGVSREKELVTGMSNGVSRETFQTSLVDPKEVNGKPVTPEIKEKIKDESLGSEAKMWESYKVDRDISTEMETEHGSSLDDEVESKADNTESLDLNRNPSENGSSSEPKQQRKKKPLYRKFGNLLKKGISNPK